MTDSLLNIGFTQLWQLSLLILAVGVLARTVCRNRPHAAMVLWLLVLVKCVTPPIVAAPFGLFCRTAEQQVEPAAPVQDTGPFGFFVKQEPVPPVEVQYLTYSEPFEMSVPVEEPIAEPVEPLTTRDWFVIAWLVGTALVILIAFTRVVLCLHRIKRTSVAAPEELVERLEQLRSKLGIRRRVSLLITSSAIGPAVIGLFRLRIVVPEVIARDGADKLEPILAHELIHIRRGDLWVGLLSLIAKGLWWFHPLVWWVSKQISRDTERACDEDVLTALGCRPADYARSLLRVLEQKNELKAMPAFPGVRPVEITSQRMERIMSLRQGSRSGGSWRRRLLFVVAAAVVLPGAVVSQEAKPVPEPEKVEEHKKQIVVKATIVEAAAADVPAAFREIQRTNAMVVTPAAKLAQEQTHSPAPSEPSVSKTTTPGFRSLAPQELEASLAALVARKDASILSAPKLICNDGERASIQTSGDDLVSLEVTPRVTENGIKLKYRLEVTQHQEDGGKIVRRNETTYDLKDGKALVQTGCETDGRELVLILEANEVKVAPPAASVEEMAAASRSLIVQTPAFMKDPAVRNLQVTPVAIGEPTAVGPFVYTTALLAELSADQEIDFDGHSPARQDLAVSRVVGENSATTETATLYELPLGEPTDLVQRMNQAGKLTVVARPKLMTVLNKEASILFGHGAPVTDSEGHNLRIQLSVNPSLAPPKVSADESPERKPSSSPATDGPLQADMNLLYHQLGQEPLKFNLAKISPLTRDKSQMLVVKLSDKKKLLIAFHAQVMKTPKPESVESSLMPLPLPPPTYRPPAPQKKTVRVRVEGAVEAPGIYTVPAGPRGVLHAAAMAGGLTQESNACVSVGTVPVVHGESHGTSHTTRTPRTRVHLQYVLQQKRSVTLKPNDVVTFESGTKRNAIPLMLERSYGLFDLVASDGDPQNPGAYSIEEAIQHIHACVASESWNKGRPKAIPNAVFVAGKGFEPAPSVSVRVTQTIENHLAIEKMLSELRQKNQPASPFAYTGSAPLITRTYKLGHAYSDAVRERCEAPVRHRLSGEQLADAGKRVYLKQMAHMYRMDTGFDSPDHRAAVKVEPLYETMSIRITDTETNHEKVKQSIAFREKQANESKLKSTVQKSRPGKGQGSERPLSAGSEESARVPPAPTTVRVTVQGAVGRSAVYDVPAGDNNLMAAIALARGLRPDYGGVVNIRRTVKSVRQVQNDGVEQASHSQSSTIKQIKATIKDVKSGKQLVSLQDGDDVHVLVAEPGRLTPLTLNQFDSTWNLAVSMAMPLRLRTAHAQVKNYELKIERAELELKRAREQGQPVDSLEWNLKSLRLSLKAAKSLQAGIASQEEANRILMALQTLNSSSDADPKEVANALKAYHESIARLEATVAAIPKTGQVQKPAAKPKHSGLIALAYPVADLVTPIVAGATNIDQMLVSELKARIHAISPDFWATTGKKTPVTFEKNAIAFVIWADRPMHDRIQGLFTQLRGTQPGQATLNVSLIEVTSDEAAVRTSAGTQLTKFTSLVGNAFYTGGKRLASPRLTVFSGGTSDVRAHGLLMKFRTKIEGEKLIVSTTVGDQVTSWIIPNGQTGLADMTSGVSKVLGKTAGKRYYLKVKAKIIIQEEEEELVRGTLVNEPLDKNATRQESSGSVKK